MTDEPPPASPSPAPQRVCLVRPPSHNVVDSIGTDATPPLALAYLASSLIAAGHEVHAVDGVGESIRQYTFREDYEGIVTHGLTHPELISRIPPEIDVVGITIMFSTEWIFSRALIREIRQAFPEAMIVVGGEHVTACPEYCLDDCPEIDVAVLGEGEATIVDLVARAGSRELESVDGIVYRRDGETVRTPPRARIRDIDSIPEPSWDLFPVLEYIENAFTHGTNLGRCMPILASRGCPFRCTFCSSPAMWTTLWRAREPELVLQEMKKYMRLYGATNFDFYDLTAIVKKDWIVKFCRLLIDEDLGITWQLPSGTRSEAIDEEVAVLLYASGCRNVNYAPESGSPEELKRIQKRVTISSMLDSMRAVTRAGIEIKVNFIFGIPGSTLRNAIETFGFLTKLAWIGVRDAACFSFSPYPGTQIFRDLVASNEIELGDDYFLMLLYQANPVTGKAGYRSRSLSYSSIVNKIGIAYFYSLSFLLRPWRALEIFIALFKGDNTLKLMMALSNRKRKRMAYRLAKKTGEKTVIIEPNYRPKARESLVEA